MELSEPQISRFHQHIRSRNADRCSICRIGELQPLRVSQLMNYTPGVALALGGGGGVVPVVEAACSNCGHIECFAALATGIIDQSGNPIE